MIQSLAEFLAQHPTERKTFWDALPLKLKERYKWSWLFWSRPSQRAPMGDWVTWLLMAGRGHGKTRAGAEWVRDEIESGRRRSLALVAPTVADVRDVMVEGNPKTGSSILEVSHPTFRPTYEPTKRKLTWPNGAVALTFSADEPDRLRGPQFDGMWCDELGIWRYPTEAWDNLQFGLRLNGPTGAPPRGVVTTTPKPIKVLRDLLTDAGSLQPTCRVTRGSTYENIANLAPSFIKQVVKKYEGTSLGRQELHAEMLAEVPGALWLRRTIDATRVTVVPDLIRIVVAIDPSASSGEESAETGIIVAGTDYRGHGYVLEDLSLRASPGRWGREAVKAYHRWRADRIIGEVNNGGEMVEHVIRTVDPTVSYKAVHASRGKIARAEPVAALYEQGKVHHVNGFSDLEDQMCLYVPGGPSPDRMDAVVWALTDLLVGQTTFDADAVSEAIRIADAMFKAKVPT